MVSVPTFCCVKKYTGQRRERSTSFRLPSLSVSPGMGRRYRWMKECAPPIRIVASGCRRTSLFSVTATGRWVLLLQKNSLFYPKETTCPFTFSNFSQVRLQRLEWQTESVRYCRKSRMLCALIMSRQVFWLLVLPVELPVVWPYQPRAEPMRRIITTMMSVLMP